jgi:3-oxoacyl-[acyl-carrier-protein] synthase-3
MAQPSAHPAPTRPGVRLVSTGMALPSGTMSNADLEKIMDTSDEWIVQRTGIRTRRIIDRDKGECTLSLASDALNSALARGNLKGSDLDLIVCATMTPEMSCPPTACRLARNVGAGNAGAFDLSGACSGFVFSLNVVHDLIRAGSYRTIGLVGADTLSVYMDYSTAGRGTAILFGDAAGAVVFTADPDPARGIIAQTMHTDGDGWKEIYVPREARDLAPGVVPDPSKYNRVQMNGSTVFKFAVSTFPRLIEETLAKANLDAADVDMYICHQSNARILHAARERFGLPPEKLYVNIDRYGNTVAASVPLCLHELVAAGRVKAGMKVMFVAFGAGLTWGSSLWQL